MVATGTGVAVVWGSSVTFVDGEGNITGRYDGPLEGELLSFAAAGTDGSLYLADSTSAFRLGPDSQVVWRTKLDPSRAQGEFRFPPPPLLDRLGDCTWRASTGAASSAGVCRDNTGIQSLSRSTMT